MPRPISPGYSTATYMMVRVEDATAQPAGCSFVACGACGKECVCSPSGLARSEQRCAEQGVTLLLRCNQCAPTTVPKDTTHLEVEYVERASSEGKARPS